MIRTDIISVGRFKKDPLLTQWQAYTKRMVPPPVLKEITAKSKQNEEEQILAALDSSAYVFALDERGKNLSSKDFARKLEQLAVEGQSKVQFIIGGADGLTAAVRNKADFTLSFGDQTWPHMLVRIMLIEQLYRAQQIIAGHPYHRG
jgi:23S rRNA (pseudouridine1915-N3)-methyltransferase